jgi:iron(III) transport system ATP-binding protein
MFLHIDQVSIRYPRNPAPAVQAVSLSLEAGQLGVLIGPSGSGKTTLLRAIAGLEQPEAGCILLDGDVLDGPAIRIASEQRRIGMVFQDFALFPHLSVAANIGFGLRNVSAAQRHQRVQEMLELVGLTHLHKQFPHQLSGGQQQRVALARALAPQPRLLLLDEPFSSLDVELRERLAEDVRAILKQAGITALMVTHDQMEAFAVGDVVGVMHDSRLAQWDQPEQLYHRPATRFVAEFIGHGSFVPGSLQADPQASHSLLMHTALGQLGGVTAELLERYPQQQHFDVLLRADDIVHDADSPLQARIIHKSFRGAAFLYTLQLDDGLRLLSLLPSHQEHALGSSIGIRLDLAQLVAFAPSGQHRQAPH